MKQGFIYVKKLLPVLDFWAVLCGLFTLFFIFARANFEGPQMVKIFIVSFIVCLPIGAIAAFLTSGGARLLFGIRLEHPDAFLLNSYVSENGRIFPDVSDENLKKIFYYIKRQNIIGFFRTIIYASPVVLVPALVVYLMGTSFWNIAVIIIGGVIGVLALALFTMFYTEYFFVGLLRECRSLMEKRDINPEEGIQLSSLKNRFYFFIIIFILLVGIFLAFIPRINPFIWGIFIIGFLIMSVLARVLFNSIFVVFQEIRSFIEKLSKSEKAGYFSGSSYKEVLDLSKDFQKSADELYEAREKEKILTAELKENVSELNKWYHLTLGREMRMVELKEEIKKLKNKMDKPKVGHE